MNKWIAEFDLEEGDKMPEHMDLNYMGANIDFHCRPMPMWIPVSESLPKTFEHVNCTCHSLIDDREDWVVETVYIPQLPDSPYSDWGNIPMLNEGNCEVVAWIHRDIPKPYKAESEGKDASSN